jgi:glycosyltransferase involved in cell wall biosynthesis
MKILQIIKGLDIGGKNGGSEQFGLNLSRYLRQDPAGHQVSLCAFYQHATPTELAWEERLRGEGIPVFYAVPRGGKGLGAAFGRLAGTCRARQVEVVHSHFQVGSLAAVYLKWSRPATVVLRTAHITQEWGSGPVAWLARQVFSAWIFPLVMDAQAGVSEAITQQIASYPGTRLAHRCTELIYNGIPPEWIANAENAVQGRIYDKSAEADFVIGSAGRLTPRKGYASLLQAFARLLPDFPRARLVLVGEGEQGPELRRLAQAAGMSDRIEFTGQVFNPLEYLARMDLFVLPSLSEGLPTTILEAMACGTPVVATDIPGTRELVTPGETGWLVPVSDADGLRQTLVEACRSPEERQRFARQAAQRLGRYSYRTATQQYAALYARLQTASTGGE